MKCSVKELILFGVLAAILTISQVAFSFIPNVETVSLLIIIYSLIYEKKSIYIVMVFVIMMGLIYGFGTWWFGYLIIWPLLSICTYFIRNIIKEKYLALSIYSGIFGLIFGLLYAIPIAVFSGINAGVGYWIAGIPYDIIHGAGNYFILLLLGEKIFNLLSILNKKYFYNGEF